MSRYGDADYDDMAYELDEFLKNHRPSELLKLVQDAVEWWEEKNNEQMCEKAVRNQPSAEQERKTGTWIEYIPEHGRCSICGNQVDLMTPEQCNYCSNCGAKMEM